METDKKTGAEKMIWENNNFMNAFVSKERNFYIFKNNFGNEKFEFLLYVTILILIPLIFHSQIIAGILVNAILAKSALDYGVKRIALISVLPSLSVIAGGFIFGNLNYALVYVLPFIWVGNFIFAVSIKKLFVSKKVNYFLSGIFASVAKSALLFTAVFVLFSFSLVPELFLTAFGIFQLFTALTGMITTGLLRMKIKDI